MRVCRGLPPVPAQLPPEPSAATITPPPAPPARRFQGRQGLPGAAAVINAVEHPLHASRPAVRVTGDVNDEAIVVAVRDYGRWKHRTPSSQRGHGYPLMRAMARSVELNRLPTGTVVRLSFPQPRFHTSPER